MKDSRIRYFCIIKIRAAVKKYPEFFDIDSLVHREFKLAGHFYLKFCRGCAMQIRGSGATSGRGSGLCITMRHRATHCHVAQQFLSGKNIPVVTQPLYSPDLAKSDFWLFPTLEMGIKGTCFSTMKDIKSNAMAELLKTPKEAFCRCFQQLQDRWVCVCVCVCVCGCVFVCVRERERER
jgi:hypothetical protein